MREPSEKGANPADDSRRRLTHNRAELGQLGTAFALLWNLTGQRSTYVN